MLSISRMESSSAAVKRESVDLAVLVEEQLRLYEELFRQKSQSLSPI